MRKRKVSNQFSLAKLLIVEHIHPIQSGLGIDRDGGGVVSGGSVNMVGGGLATIEA